MKIADFTGVVERMSLRATVLRNLEGQVYVVPNGNIPSVTVMTKEWARFPDDILWRRSKLGLTMPAEDRNALAAFMATPC